MLNRPKLIKQLHELENDLFVDFSDEYNYARNWWQTICADSTFSYKIRACNNSPWPLPYWRNKLDQQVVINQREQLYVALSVDGSQVYPDKHQGTLCYLINIGVVTLFYGYPEKSVFLHSEPHLFLANEGETITSRDMVNCKRQEFELRFGLEYAVQLKNDNFNPVFLFDGSLIFWHLDAGDIEIKQFFLDAYLQLLQQLYEHRILMAGYISMPKSKELVNLIRIAAIDFDIKQSEQAKKIDHVIDVNIADFYLKPFTRTNVFQNNSSISSLYPEHLRTFFFYLHVGTEIARIEIPAWIAQDENQVNTIAQIMCDQAHKGRGYPVALAEAHEQAVVKGPDREFFYHLITKVGITKQKRIQCSPKSLKKRGIGI